MFGALLLLLTVAGIGIAAGTALAFVPSHGPMQPTFAFRRRHGTSIQQPVLFMGLKVTIRIVGRKQGGEEWLEEACDMYLTRLKQPSGLEVTTEWHKSDAALLKGVAADCDKNVPVVLLDPLGSRMTSEKLADNIYQWLEKGGSRLVFVIGGAEGLPSELKDGAMRNKPFILLSLSELTFTHQFARLVLIEQIYRATEIRKGSGYHK